MSNRQIILIAHNIRSSHNVGSLFRTAEGLGVEKLILSGYTPHPARSHDNRLPHEVLKTEKQIDKTALGAQNAISWEWHESLPAVIASLKRRGWTIAALEQTEDAKELPKYHPPHKIVLILGSEVEGIDPGTLQHADICLEIPMFGKKESYNVAQAAAMGLYHLRFTS